MRPRDANAEAVELHPPSARGSGAAITAQEGLRGPAANEGPPCPSTGASKWGAAHAARCMPVRAWQLRYSNS
jgi:hypothetical protein